MIVCIIFLITPILAAIAGIIWAAATLPHKNQYPVRTLADVVSELVFYTYAGMILGPFYMLGSIGWLICHLVAIDLRRILRKKYIKAKGRYLAIYRYLLDPSIRGLKYLEKRVGGHNKETARYLSHLLLIVRCTRSRVIRLDTLPLQGNIMCARPGDIPAERITDFPAQYYSQQHP